jgi:hypothetical protein
MHVVRELFTDHRSPSSSIHCVLLCVCLLLHIVVTWVQLLLCKVRSSLWQKLTQQPKQMLYAARTHGILLALTFLCVWSFCYHPQDAEALFSGWSPWSQPFSATISFVVIMRYSRSRLNFEVLSSWSIKVVDHLRYPATLLSDVCCAKLLRVFWRVFSILLSTSLDIVSGGVRSTGPNIRSLSGRGHLIDFLSCKHAASWNTDSE